MVGIYEEIPMKWWKLLTAFLQVLMVDKNGCSNDGCICFLKWGYPKSSNLVIKSIIFRVPNLKKRPWCHIPARWSARYDFWELSNQRQSLAPELQVQNPHGNIVKRSPRCRWLTHQKLPGYVRHLATCSLQTSSFQRKLYNKCVYSI